MELTIEQLTDLFIENRSAIEAELLNRGIGLENNYKVRLLDGHLAKPDQTVNGYLGSGEPQTYTRGEAIKKARMFGGKIEKL